MYYPSEREFVKLAKKGNLIPVYKELVADLETPVSAYKKIESEYSFLLESVEGGEQVARYSFLGSVPPKNVIRPGTLDELDRLMRRYRPVQLPQLPPFCGGLVGYVGYDAVREMEKIPNKNPDPLKLPQALFLLADTLLAFDHVKHKILIIANAHLENKDPRTAYRAACSGIAALEKKLRGPLTKMPKEISLPLNTSREVKFSSNLGKKEYENMVKKAKEYIRAGDVIQVVLSQRLETECRADPFDVYRVLRMINPSPYMYFLKLGELKVVGSSPEVMVRLSGRTATVRPIAGTIRRGSGEEEDKKLEAELLSNKKELAEHVMLVDLGRNDLGRVCEFGSVAVTEKMTIERYSHVMHIVSNVTGRLQRGKTPLDLLKACFPAGTVSGAPKVRAMEIIDELENLRRGLYAGCVGYLSFSGDLDTAITIRTILIKEGKAYLQAGAGIVADSDPAREYQETINKAKALLSAVGYFA
ncbi:anthranilate synthase component I [candidate division WOR-1 bacterium RIFOXYA12_FULL_52_29]|uniref:Anthranilate synthase component 1 n=1 Tax=candidate division WOR-1 bacterium RIFOXYC12_FULL_54_18 TaxID=1802584 RepID=A0A1F4T4F8_UNCSA|nr:MAG: anthranilate synthase component I [candidate division WOR-1 bacterium RIFOXYA2_FULL_51_19]OGC17225.1 MAG: anthranilate synthase component I [candidate division WOR-1 bacterium RIFOXYA12_FULL_52_29]OGC26085.1 MAG: anthranilate synthase component I [candidate division WOR-1 bacterium RIFOXYB2_FULL_45_9]OGC27642.1 MAG: anthranilate synthase component I [candidate division WOR-1 bacterium RIFOXYC12_FULL_54_18]OGC29144.1 MAG: anthranilate synthase component I [candidate division WOR-1 bacter